MTILAVAIVGSMGRYADDNNSRPVAVTHPDPRDLRPLMRNPSGPKQSLRSWKDVTVFHWWRPVSRRAVWQTDSELAYS